jgi:hypothetical protein
MKSFTIALRKEMIQKYDVNEEVFKKFRVITNFRSLSIDVIEQELSNKIDTKSTQHLDEG